MALNNHGTEFRVYHSQNEDVKNTYELNHHNQTVSFVDQVTQDYTSFNRAKMTVWGAMDLLNSFIDKSDPDFSAAQSCHAFLTAEDLRRRFPDDDWLHLCGLLHDLGKVLSLPLFGSLPQWAVVGDTFPVGCAHSHKIVHYPLFSGNEDTKNEKFNTENGIYEANCGLENLKMSWGHDEYLYQLLLKNNCTIPKMGLNVIRFHSFYSWHKEGAYRHLMTSQDEDTLVWVKRFSQSDLYSKSHTVLTQSYINETLHPYYESLIVKYFPNPVLYW